MAIRRFREHVAEQNWFAVLVDVLIVVLGVFLGLQVNNWNQARIEKQQGLDYRQRLIRELDFDSRQYALQAAYYRQARTYGLQALAALKGSKSLSDREFLIATYQLTQVDTTKAKSYVYDEMTANGLVHGLGDDEVQQLASDFYLSVDATQRALLTILPYRNLLREVMPYSIQIRIRSECGDQSIHYNGRLVGAATVIPCRVAIGPVEAAAAAKAVRSTPGIETQMTRYIASIDEKLDNLKIVRGQAEVLRRRLAAAPQGGAA